MAIEIRIVDGVEVEFDTELGGAVVRDAGAAVSPAAVSPAVVSPVEESEEEAPSVEA